MNSCTRFKRLQTCFEHFTKHASQMSTAMHRKAEGAKTVPELELDEEVSSAIEHGAYHPRKHPGVMRQKVDELPAALVNAMSIVTEKRKKSDIFKESMVLRNQLWGRHLPPEKTDYIEHMKLEKQRAQAVIEALNADINDKDKTEIEEKFVVKRMKDLVHPWHPMSITPETCLQYFVSRTPAEYCILHKIFSEIQQADADFIPISLFDFGSGLASGYWAARGVWQRPLQEVVNIDTNINMNELAQKILEISKEPSLAEQGMYFRQFFPFTHERTYDIVLSAFTLLELPSFQERMQAAAELWSKTNKYLVLVEDGTNAGYKAIMEARNLLTHLQSKENPDSTGAFVASPCPHEFVCPRFMQDNTPCNFQIFYLSPTFLENKQIRRTQMYSYVVFKRGSRHIDDPQWPRCVRETLLRSKQVHLKLCTSEGKLENISLSKSGTCKHVYKCAKHTRWGDLLPAKIVTKIRQQ